MCGKINYMLPYLDKLLEEGPFFFSSRTVPPVHKTRSILTYKFNQNISANLTNAIFIHFKIFWKVIRKGSCLFYNNYIIMRI